MSMPFIYSRETYYDWFFDTERTVIPKAYIVLSYYPWLFCEDYKTEFVN